MTDDLRTALLELERHAPDTAIVRNSVHQGIQARARRKRVATITGAAAGVVALAAGAVYVNGALSSNSTVPATPVYQDVTLAPIHNPDLVMPVDPASLSTGTALNYLIDAKTPIDGETLRVVETGDRGIWSWRVDVRKKPPAARHNGVKPVSEKQIQINGHPATERIYRTGNPTLIFWQLQNDEWVVVDVPSPERARAKAQALRVGTFRRSPNLRIGLAPAGARVGTVHWRDGSSAQLTVCQENAGEVPCFIVSRTDDSALAQMYNGPLGDGPDPTTGCVGGHAKGLGPPRQVDGSTVRLATDGCFALKVIGPGEYLKLDYEHLVPLPPDDFARMAASIEVSGP